MPSFLTKTIEVDVDARTWIKPATIPPYLKNASRWCSIDVGQALLLLGTLTMPNSMSPASPSLFWAWVRYYLAPTSSADLRITMDFAALDPHQKGILSDDFGVAITTQWMIDRLGGCKKILGARQFVLQFPQHVRKRQKSQAKVGPSKSPDFVILDLTGKWHVLECKGTQSGRGYQRESLKVAVSQKHAIQLVGAIKGEQLAAAIDIANAQDGRLTRLKVIDPDDPPLIRLDEGQAHEIEMKADRLTIARAFGTIGLNDIAIELSLPPEVDPDSELLYASESSRLRSPREARYVRASEQVRARNLTRMAHGDRAYEGREVRLELPPTTTPRRFRSVVVRQGVSPELIEAFAAPDWLLKEMVDEHVRPFVENARVVQAADDNHMTLSYGDVLFSEVIWE